MTGKHKGLGRGLDALLGGGTKARGDGELAELAIRTRRPGNYQPRARSKKGAKGLMQLMPGTARQYGVSNSYDPKSNLEAGVKHLKDLMSRLELPIALAAYNAGEGTVRRYGGLPPFPETQAYVRNILRRVPTN